MKQVMLDLETLGSRPGSVIFSIGAVVFTDTEIQEQFYSRIDPRSAVECGLTMDADTVIWWMKQSDEARAEFQKLAGNIYTVLIEFSTWLNDLKSSIELWGNGSDFDNTLLAEAFRLNNIPLPWKYYNNRCYRTIKSLYPEIKAERTGTYHNALDDARSQAMHLQKILKVIKPQTV